MTTDPIINFKEQKSKLERFHAAWAQNRDNLSTLGGMLDTAVEKSLPESFVAECRRTSAQVRADGLKAEADYHLQAKIVDAAQKGLGTELREVVDSAIESLKLYQSNISLRDREGGQLVFEDVQGYLETAKTLHDFIYPVTALVNPTVHVESGHPAPISQGSMFENALPAPQEFHLPAEMSEYCTGARNGYALKNFAEKFTSGLERLFEQSGRDVEKTARYLAQYGLNGGVLLAPETVDSLLRGVGITLAAKKVSLVSPTHVRYSGSSHIAAARAYIEGAIGLNLVYERCSSLFNSGFRVTRSPAGVAKETFTLTLQGLNKERLTELLGKISRRLSCGMATWADAA